MFALYILMYIHIYTQPQKNSKPMVEIQLQHVHIVHLAGRPARYHVTGR